LSCTGASREAAEECSPGRKPWVKWKPDPSPEGAKETNPKCSGVVGDVVFLQENHEFVLERMLLVMGLLTGDVSDDGFDIRLADAECAVPCLPCEIALAFFTDPSR
jgi:hypothetical protein